MAFGGENLGHLINIKTASLNASFANGLTQTNTLQKQRNIEMTAQLFGYSTTGSHKRFKRWNLSNHSC